MAYPVIAFIHMLERVKKAFPVMVVHKDGLLPVSTGSDMVYCAGVFYAKWAGHDDTIAKQDGFVKPQDLTL